MRMDVPVVQRVSQVCNVAEQQIGFMLILIIVMIDNKKG